MALLVGPSHASTFAAAPPLGATKALEVSWFKVVREYEMKVLTSTLPPLLVMPLSRTRVDSAAVIKLEKSWYAAGALSLVKDLAAVSTRSMREFNNCFKDSGEGGEERVAEALLEVEKDGTEGKEGLGEEDRDFAAL